jgi:hypothetical protein
MQTIMRASLECADVRRMISRCPSSRSPFT